MTSGDISNPSYLYPHRWPPDRPVARSVPAPRPLLAPRPAPADQGEAGQRGLSRPPAEAPAPGRAVIGNALRQPAVWCDFGACIERFTHREALGLADVRARAVAAGWRQDALGRYACPRCQQQDAAFQVTMPLVPWRSTSITPLPLAEPAVLVLTPALDGPPGWLDEPPPAEELARLPEGPLAESAWDSSPMPTLRLAAPPAEADHRRFRIREAGRHRLTS